MSDALPDLVLLGHPVELIVPSSIAERYDLLLAEGSGISPSRVLAAAVGICWMRARRELQRAKVSYRGDMSDFGGKALDYFIGERGASYQELAAVGGRALAMCAEGLPGLDLPASEVEADELLGNSSDTEG